jgi:hypothetical protein
MILAIIFEVFFHGGIMLGTVSAGIILGASLQLLDPCLQLRYYLVAFTYLQL